MSTKPIDYDALARQYGATSSTAPQVDYDALAKQYGATSSQHVSSVEANYDPATGKWIEQPSEPATPFRGTVQAPSQETPYGNSAPARYLSNFYSGMGIGPSTQANPSEFITGPLMAIRHPSLLAESVGEMGKGAWNAMQETNAQAQKELSSPGIGNKVTGAIHWLESGVPVVGPMLAQAGNQIDKGDIAGGLGTTTAIVAPVIAGSPTARATVGEAVRTVGSKMPSPRGMMANRMNEVPAGEQFSRGEVNQAARAHGVNLDVAQATDSGVAHAVKKANRYSLTAQGTYDSATTKNVNALEQWADSEASKYSPNGATREVVGGQLQQALKSHLEARKNLAANLYQQLDSQVGGVPQDVTQTVAAEAQKIIDANSSYYAKHPELRPTKAWSIIQDLANRPTIEKSVPMGDLIDAAGNPVTQTVKAKGPAVVSWSELHQLRSDLMDFYRNNPDIVKGQGEAWIQQMVGKIDNAMTEAHRG